MEWMLLSHWTASGIFHLFVLFLEAEYQVFLLHGFSGKRELYSRMLYELRGTTW
jgi:hypothetical protein